MTATNELRDRAADGVRRAKAAAARVGTQHSGWDIASDGEALLAGKEAIGFSGTHALADFVLYCDAHYPEMKP